VILGELEPDWSTTASWSPTRAQAATIMAQIHAARVALEVVQDGLQPLLLLQTSDCSNDCAPTEHRSDPIVVRTARQRNQQVYKPHSYPIVANSLTAITRSRAMASSVSSPKSETAAWFWATASQKATLSFGEPDLANSPMSTAGRAGRYADWNREASVPTETDQ
jgi:hypothetical protein